MTSSSQVPYTSSSFSTGNMEYHVSSVLSSTDCFPELKITKYFVVKIIGEVEILFELHHFVENSKVRG